MDPMRTITINGETYTSDDPDAVSFKETQVLTDGQMETARQNIGAAADSEVIKSVNGHAPGENGAVQIIDDTKAGADAWSSKNTVDRLCPEFTQSGSVVTCQPVEGYPLQVQWCKKNLYKPTVPSTSKSGITFTVNADGSVTANGTAEENAYFSVGGITLPVGDYVLSGCPEGGGTGKYMLYINLADGTIYNKSEEVVFTNTDSTARYSMYVYIAAGQTVSDLTFYPMVRPVGTDSGYEPYVETPAGITRSGKNLANAMSIVNGSSNTSVEVSDDGYTIVSVGGTKAWANADIEVDITGLQGKTVYIKADSIGYTQTYYAGILPIAYTPGGPVYLDSVQPSTLKRSITLPGDTNRFILRICTNNTGDTHDTDNTMTVKGLIVSLKDYTDWEPYRGCKTFAPGDAIPALPGVNTIYADAGLVTVTGKADPVAIINNLQTRLAAIEAAIVSNT